VPGVVWNLKGRPWEVKGHGVVKFNAQRGRKRKSPVEEGKVGRRTTIAARKRKEGQKKYLTTAWKKKGGT